MLFKKYNKEEIDEYMENFTIMSEDESDVSDTENEWASEEIPGRINNSVDGLASITYNNTRLYNDSMLMHHQSHYNVVFYKISAKTSFVTIVRYP